MSVTDVGRRVQVPLVDLGLQHAEIADEVARGWAQVLASCDFVQGAAVAAFEEEFASSQGVRHCVGVANGTDALELAVRALGIGPGDEVLVPANSFIASASSVRRAGARCVLVDVQEDTYLMDPDAAAAAVGASTKALMPVHLYGQIAPMDAIRDIAALHDAFVIEDAAQAQGAAQDGIRAGALGDVAATSFYPGKNLGAYGDGGAVLTGSSEVAERVRALANHGASSKYEHPTLGFNSRLDTLQAVVLSAKLARLERWNDDRRGAAARYNALLADEPRVIVPKVAAGNAHVWHLYVIRVPERDRVVAEMKAQGVGVGIHYPIPLHLQGALSDLGYAKGAFPIAERVAGEVMTLPLFPGITAEQQERVADVLVRSL